jgi:hypothetical protein
MVRETDIFSQRTTPCRSPALFDSQETKHAYEDIRISTKKIQTIE